MKPQRSYQTPLYRPHFHRASCASSLAYAAVWRGAAAAQTHPRLCLDRPPALCLFRPLAEVVSGLASGYRAVLASEWLFAALGVGSHVVFDFPLFILFSIPVCPIAVGRLLLLS